MVKRRGIPLLVLAFFALHAQSVFACGGLIAPDGDVRLARATTLVAWHDGIERYMTAFAYQETNAHSVANLGPVETPPCI